MERDWTSELIIIVSTPDQDVAENDSGQVVDTWVALCLPPSSTIWYWPKGSVLCSQEDSTRPGGKYWQPTAWFPQAECPGSAQGSQSHSEYGTIFTSFKHVYALADYNNDNERWVEVEAQQLTEVSLHAQRLVLPELCNGAAEQRNNDALHINQRANISTVTTLQQTSSLPAHRTGVQCYQQRYAWNVIIVEIMKR